MADVVIQEKLGGYLNVLLKMAMGNLDTNLVDYFELSLIMIMVGNLDKNQGVMLNYFL